MDNFKKYFSKGSFLVIILCFLLPFVTVKCNNQEIAKVSGASLVYGGEMQINMPDMNFGNNNSKNAKTKKETKKVDVNMFVVLAFLFALIGLVLSFTSLEKAKQISLIVSILGVISLILFAFDGKMPKEKEGQTQQEIKIAKMITISLGTGYYLVFLLFLINALYFGYELKYFEKFLNKKNSKPSNTEEES